MVNNNKYRTNIIVYDVRKKPAFLIECKEPKVEVNQDTLEQALKYNHVLIQSLF